MILAGVVFNFTVTGALLRPTEFYSKKGHSILSKKIKEEKYEIKQNGNLQTLEGELALLVEENDLTEGGTKLHRSHELLPIPRVERLRSFSDTTGMKTPDKSYIEEKDKSSSFRPLKHLVESLEKNELLMLGSTMDIDGSLYSFSSAHLNTPDNQNDQRQDTATLSHEICFATIPRTIKSILLQIFNTNVLSNRLFMMFMFVAATSIIGMDQISMFLPAHSEDIGISKRDVALLLAIMGSLDLVARLVLAFISDWKFIKRHHMLAIASIITGVVVNFVHFFKDFNTMLILVITFGCFGQTYSGMYAVIIADFVGVERMSSAMGIISLLHGVMLTFTSPIIGNLFKFLIVSTLT